MENNRKIKVGITHGDINGVGYEVILKTFSDSTMLELCTPIVYGSPKVAAYHRKAMDIPTNFSIINSAEGAMDDRLNILNCTEDELKVELTKIKKLKYNYWTHKEGQRYNEVAIIEQ